MNRRAFLGLTLAGSAGMAFDPERLLWVPGAKKIFDLGPVVVPSVNGGNTLLTIDHITLEALATLKNELGFTRAGVGDFSVLNKRGDSIRIRRAGL